MISWEYPTVLKRTKVKDLLIAACNKLITEDQSEKIIYQYLYEHELKDGVRFTGTSGRGRCEYFNEKVNIMLPGEKTGKLTLGITLHELAHALAFIEKKERGHSDIFVQTFDKLLKSENEYKYENN